MAMWDGTSYGLRAAKPQQAAWPTLSRACLLLWPYRLRIFAYLLTITASALVGLVQALLVRQIIDHALPAKDGSQLDLLAVAMLAFSVLFGGIGASGGGGGGGAWGGGGLTGVFQAFLSNSISQSLMHDLRSKLFRHLSDLPLRWFTANRTGETISRINNDVNAIQNVVTDTFGGVLSNSITLVSTLAFVLAMDWRLALIAVVFVPLFILPAHRVGNVQRGLQRGTQEQMAALSGQMQETLSVSGALLMKNFGRQEDERGKFDETSREVRRLSIRRAMTGRWFQMSMGLFGSVGVVLVYWYVGHRVINGETTVGTLVALATLVPRLFGPTAQLINVNVTMLSSLALFERIFDYLDLDVEIRDRPGALELSSVRGEVEFSKVNFSYIEGQPALREISFAVPAGKFAALVGPTGAGKTTIAYMVPRLYDTDTGQVLIDGHDVKDVTQESLGRCVGMVSQETFLLHTSVRENLRYAKPDATDEEIEQAARAARIHDYIASLPEGYDTTVGERGYRLSGGEKQRLAIARALLKDPAVLILDEATSSVDTVTEREIQEAMENVTRGRTVIAIAHRLSTVLNADIILVIDGGRLVESGTHSELMALGAKYFTLYEQQLLAVDSDEVKATTSGNGGGLTALGSVQGAADWTSRRGQGRGTWPRNE